MKEKRESRRGKGGREEKSLTVVAATEINHYEHNRGGELFLSIGELYCWQTEVVPVDVTVMEKRWEGNAVIVALPLLIICGLWYIHSLK